MFGNSTFLFLFLFLSGDNGTIDGQGESWWNKFHKGELQYTRPYLIEIMYSENVQISNLTLLNSPSWNVHPIYSRLRFTSCLSVLFSIRFSAHFSFFVYMQQCDSARPNDSGTCKISKHRWYQSRYVAETNIAYASSRAQSTNLVSGK